MAQQRRDIPRAVLSTTGEAIAGASVNLITVATVSTNPLGQFEITVPRNRTLDEYKLQVSAPGYEISQVMTRSPAELKNAEIRLTPAADPELVKGIEPTVMVGQFLGYPFALVTLRVENDGDSLLSINQIQGRLSGNDTAFVLAPMSWTIAGIFGPFAPVTGPFPIFAGTKLDLRVVMMPGANLASLYNQLGALPEYANQAPCTPKFNGTVDPLTSEAFEIVKTFSEDRFGWREGGWTLQLEVSTEGEDKKTFEHEFAISESDLNRLRTSLRLAKSCLGVHFTAPLAQDGSVANFLSK